MDDRAEYRGLLRQVLEEPAEDWPRLVLADWLEDDGQADRAELIRVQLAMAKLPCGCEMTPTHADCVFCAGGGPELLLRNLRLKERLDWLREFRAVFGESAVMREYGVAVLPEARDMVAVGMTRGLVSHLSMKAAHFTPEAALWLFGNHPITSVHLRDKKPHHRADSDVHVWSSFESGWTIEPAYHVHKDILNRAGGRHVNNFRFSYMSVVHYDSAESALLGLNDGCVDYGRELAGLPPLRRGK